jgi:hypothetical protein
MYGAYEVEAETIEEACKLIELGEPPFSEVPFDAGFIDDSMEVNYDILQECNPQLKIG